MMSTLVAAVSAVLIAANAMTFEDETSGPADVQRSEPGSIEAPGQPQAAPAQATGSGSDIPGLAEMDAYHAVKEGNRLLRDGKPGTALQAYARAGELEPEARQIAFGEGLAHYKLKELDKARESFEKAVGPADDCLADDAQYSLGTCDHTEALDNLTGNPQLATSLLESAMRRYHDVLQRRPDHAAARDANLKAASMWRQLKERLQQQQQQQQSCDKDQQQDEKEKQEQEQREQQNQNEQQQEQQARPQDENEQQEEQKEAQASDQKQADEQQEQQMQAQKEEQVSREQAERQLREMMQAHRDRQRLRREQVQRIPVKPVDKDW